MQKQANFCVVITVYQKLQKTNLWFCKYILHIVDWAIWDPTTFKEVQPLVGHFFFKPKIRPKKDAFLYSKECNTILYLMWPSFEAIYNDNVS